MKLRLNKTDEKFRKLKSNKISSDDKINNAVSKDDKLDRCSKVLEKSVDSDDLKFENKISVFYTNARSVVNKFDELKLYVKDEKPDIVSITESCTHEI